MLRLVLASTSPWRRKMLETAGIFAEAQDPGVDESTVTLADPSERAVALARLKATAVRQKLPALLCLGADQVVFDPVSGEIFGKPTSAADQHARLASMRGRAHHLVTGWWLSGPDGERGGSCTTVMHVRADITDAEIAAYVRSGEGSGCAGGYAAELTGGFLFERVEGDWFNVIGLPLFEVTTALRALGWRHGGV